MKRISLKWLWRDTKVDALLETSLLEDRAVERHRRIKLTVLSGVFAKVVSMLTLFISVPLTLNYLGEDQYGLWMTISSFTGLIGFADLGMGNGLLNAISDANGRDDRSSARTYVTSGFLMLLMIAIFLAMIFCIGQSWISWGKVLKINSQVVLGEAISTILVLAACFVVSMPLGVVQRVQMAYQEGFQSNLWQCLSSTLTLFAVLIIICTKMSLPWLVLAIVGTPAVVLLLNFLIYFGLQRPWLRPDPASFSFAASRKLLGLGLMFFLLQIVAAVGFNSDNMIALKVLNARAVTENSIALRLFSPLIIITSVLMQPLWPAYGEAFARGDTKWGIRILYRSLKLCLLITISCSFIIIVFKTKILSIWLRTEITLSYLLVIGHGAWAILMSCGSAVGVFMNGMGLVKTQVVCALCFAPVAVISKWYLTKLYGVEGIVWASVLSYSICILIPLAIIIPLEITKMRCRSSSLHLEPVT